MNYHSLHICIFILLRLSLTNSQLLMQSLPLQSGKTKTLTEVCSLFFKRIVNLGNHFIRSRNPNYSIDLHRQVITRHGSKLKITFIWSTKFVYMDHSIKGLLRNNGRRTRLVHPLSDLSRLSGRIIQDRLMPLKNLYEFSQINGVFTVPAKWSTFASQVSMPSAPKPWLLLILLSKLYYYGYFSIVLEEDAFS